MSKRRILVVEDSDLSRNFITLALAGHPDLEVLEARDGDEAWRILQRESVDLVLTDLNMPRLTGVDLVRKIRAAAPPLRDVVVVVITSSGEEGSQDEARAAGADAFLSKPVSASELDPILGAYLRETRATERGQGTGLLLQAAGPTRDARAIALGTRVGARVITASSSLEAFGQLFLHEVTFIVADLQMPGREAALFLKRVRESAYATVPVFLLADDRTRADLEELGNFGAAKVFPADADSNVLCNAVSEVLTTAR